MSEAGILVRLLEHNLWANAQVLAACRPLGADQLETETIGTYGAVSQTLVHLARAQGGYLRRLTGWQPDADHRLEYEDPFPGVERIAEHLAFTGERLIEVAGRASADQVLEFEYDGELQRLPAWVVLLQAAHHATEHRQQLATALTALGLEPPEPDLWAFWGAIERGEVGGAEAAASDQMSFGR